MNSEVENAVYTEKKQLMSKWLLATVYTAFICLQLGQVQAIADFSYRLHELLYLPVNLAIFAVPIQFLVYIYFVFKSWGEPKPDVGSKAVLVKRVLVSASLVLIFFVLSVQSYNTSVSGIFTVTERLQTEKQYYLNIGDGKIIECTRNEFQLIVPGKEYLVNYQWNSRLNKGSLDTIEPVMRP